jgi:glycosyltransferase involved in cell wall biosynthesis
MVGEKPIVVSDCPAQVSIVQECECGLVHKANDAQDLADKLLALYRNPFLARTLGENGKKAVMEKI